MKTRNIRHKHPRRGVLPGGSARQRRQKRSSQQENNEPRRRYSCDCTGIAPPFLSFLRRFYRSGTGNPTRTLLKIAYRGAQEGPVRACGARAGQVSGRRRNGAGWARSSLCAVQRRRGRLRPSAARSAEAPNRRAPLPTPCKQTPSMKGAGNADIGEAVNFLFYAALLSKRLRARSAEKQIRTRAADTIPPYLRFRSWGLRTPAGGQALIARGQNFQGGLPHDLTLYFLHNS